LSPVAGVSGSPRGAQPAPAILFWPWAGDQVAVRTLLGLLAGSGSDTGMAVMLPAGGYGRELAQAVDEHGRPDGGRTQADRERTRAAGACARARLTILDCDIDEGFAAGLNDAAGASGRGDLVVVADACALPDGWLARLGDAAGSDDTVAGASPLLGRQTAGAPDVRAPLHPRIFSLWAGCAYLRRAALDLVGPADGSLSHPSAVLADFTARALEHGLSCVLADDLSATPLTGGLGPCRAAELRAVSERHPWSDSRRRGAEREPEMGAVGQRDHGREPWIDAAQPDRAALDPGPLRRALLITRAAGTRLSVTVDARALGPDHGGTQAYAAGLVRALARSERCSVRAVVAGEAPPEVIQALSTGRDVEVVTYEQAISGLARTDVVHRPQQVFTPDDLALLRLLGERLVITHLDLIAYRSPVYHASLEAWRGYRRTTRLALAAADRVLFLSEHARRDAITEDLIEPGRTALTGIGIEAGPAAVPQHPDGIPSPRELLVMIGSDYVHKNRTFALALVDELRRRHGWDGLLVLAGTHVPYGSSAQAEAELLRGRPALAAHVLDVGPVSEAEKQWLLAHAQALLCPSTYEGYGLTPLEAASAGLPCVYAACTSLAEVVGPQAATIVPWDPAASADAAVGLLHAGEQRERHLALLSNALRASDWEPIVERLLGVYLDAIRSPFRSSVPRAWDELERERLVAELDGSVHDLQARNRDLEASVVALDGAYRDLEARVAHGLPLIDRGGLLTAAQQRGLMRIAARDWLSKPLLGPVGLLGRWGARP